MEGDLGIIDRQPLDIEPEEEPETQAAIDTSETATETVEDSPEGQKSVVENAVGFPENVGNYAEETEQVLEENFISHTGGSENVGIAGVNELSARANGSSSVLEANEYNGNMEKHVEGMAQNFPETLDSADENIEIIGKQQKWRTSSTEALLGSISNMVVEGVKGSPSELFQKLSVQIQTQNNVISNLNDKIKQKTIKFPKTLCEKHEIRNLNVCIQEESKKLYSLLRQVLSLHRSNPHRKWPAIELATTYTEDCKPIAFKINNPIEGCEHNALSYEDHSTTKSYSLETCEKSSEGSGTAHKRYADLFRNLEPEERKSYRHVPRSKDPLFQQLRPENRRGYSLDPKHRLKPHYVNLATTKTFDSGSGTLSPNHTIKCIQQKVENIQNELLMWERARPGSEVPRTSQMRKLQRSTTGRCVKKLGNMISSIQDILECDDTEKTSDFDKTDNSGKTDDICEKFGRCVSGNSSEEENSSNHSYQDMKSRYCELLEDYRKKEREVSKLNVMLNGLKRGKESKDNAISEGSSAEVHVLRKKLQEYQEDHEDFKILVYEQARQIDDYRAKYLATLQKVEEQKCIMQKMEIDNRRIEDQVNGEIEQIKDRFQRKINEYSKLPELLENEQIKLAECFRQKEDLEMKLRIVCRELRSVKSAQNEIRFETEDPERCKKLSNELSNLKQKYDLLKESNDDLCYKYDETCREFDLLRSESAKVICRLRERAKTNQLALQKHIDDLEKELAKCRATASVSMADREAVIKDMHAQLNCLALSFDWSQKQIKTLKDHISYISGGKTNSIVICCEPNKKR